MTKREIVMQVAEKANLTQQETQTVIEGMLEMIKKHLSEGGHVELRNFGVWKAIQSKPRVGRNPKHPEQEIAIPSRLTVRFKMTKEWQPAAQ